MLPTWSERCRYLRKATESLEKRAQGTVSMTCPDAALPPATAVGQLHGKLVSAQFSLCAEDDQWEDWEDRKTRWPLLSITREQLAKDLASEMK